MTAAGVATSVAQIGCYEAEAAVIGGLLLCGPPFVLDGYLSQIDVGDLVSPKHRAVLVAMKELRAAGEPVDHVTVLAQLRRTGLEGSMTTDQSAALYLASLVAAPPNTGSVSYYITVLLEHRVRRQVEASGTRMAQAAAGESMESLIAVVNAEGKVLTGAFERLAARPQRTVVA